MSAKCLRKSTSWLSWRETAAICDVFVWQCQSGPFRFTSSLLIISDNFSTPPRPNKKEKKNESVTASVPRHQLHLLSYCAIYNTSYMWRVKYTYIHKYFYIFSRSTKIQQRQVWCYLFDWLWLEPLNTCTNNTCAWLWLDHKRTKITIKRAQRRHARKSHCKKALIFILRLMVKKYIVFNTRWLLTLHLQPSLIIQVFFFLWYSNHCGEMLQQMQKWPPLSPIKLDLVLRTARWNDFIPLHASLKHRLNVFGPTLLATCNFHLYIKMQYPIDKGNFSQRISNPNSCQRVWHRSARQSWRDATMPSTLGGPSNYAEI